MKGHRKFDIEKHGLPLCKIIANSTKSLRTACKEVGIGVDSILKAVSEDPKFAAMYVQAKQEQADFMVEELIEIADNTENDTIVDEKGRERPNNEWIQRSRVRIDTRKWIAAKLKPQKYSDSSKIEIDGKLEVKQITGMEIK